MGTLVPIQMIHPGQRSKNRCCEPIETLKYHRHPNLRVHYFWKPALNFISGLQVLNHSDQPQFMSSLQMLPCMVFIIFLPDTIQQRDEHTVERIIRNVRTNVYPRKSNSTICVEFGFSCISYTAYPTGKPWFWLNIWFIYFSEFKQSEVLSRATPCDQTRWNIWWYSPISCRHHL